MPYLRPSRASRLIARLAAANPTPVMVAGAMNMVTSIALGVFHSCAVNAGHVYCWGDDTYGQLGDGSTGGATPTPMKVTGLP